TTNLIADRPEMVEEMTALLADCVASGRTTPGAPQANDELRPADLDWHQCNWLPEIPERFVKDD
ncbi:MAG: hypothetical protein ACYTGH_03065, partial [Planctomycetota bacterium]